MIRTNRHQGRMRTGIFDIARLQNSEIQNPSTVGFEDHRQYNARMKRESIAAAQREQEAAEQREYNADLAKHASRAAAKTVAIEELLTQPSEALSHLPRRPKAIEGATIDEISQTILFAARAAFKDMKLTDISRSHVLQILQVNDLDTMQVECWSAVRDRMKALDMFGTPAEPEPEPQTVRRNTTRATTNELLESTSSESREGHATLLAALEHDRKLDAYSTWDQFVAECKVLFSGETFTQSECDHLSKLMDVRNLNKNVLKNWRTAKVLACRAGYLRPCWLSQDEQLAWDVDRDLVPLNTHADRAAFQRKVQEIHGKTPLLG